MAGSYNPNDGGFSVGGENLQQNKSIFSRTLRDISNWGLSYDDMVIKNRVSIAINEDPNASKNYGMYDFFSQRAIASLMNKKTIPYLKASYLEKRRILREFSIKDEIRDMIITVSDESIIYNDEKNFCRLKNLPDEYSQDIKDKYAESFERIYNAFHFNDGISAWNYFRSFLVDGNIAFEIVYDDQQKNVIGFEPIDPYTLLPALDQTGKAIWIQNSEDPQTRKILLDSQIIFISYSSHNDYTELSYVESLIRPYNQLKIIEQTRIMFNMVNATIYQKFTIPINGLSKQRAEEEVSRLIADYSEQVEWDDQLGTVTINGSKHLPYNKQIWFPSGESGTPSLELVAPNEGHNLNESDTITWFFNALKRASRIPFSRFDKDNGGGNIYSDASEMTRDEVKFGAFINRLRMSFKEIVMKPLKLQMLIEFPELRKDDVFLNDIGVEFNSNDLFEEWKKLNNISKRTEIANSLLAFQDAEGKPYFDLEWIVDKVIKLSEDEKQENKSYKLKYGGGQSADPDTEASPTGEDDMGAPEPAGQNDAGPETPAAEPAAGDDNFEF